MKKSVLIILALAGALFITGCESGNKEKEHTDPSFLVGNWASETPGASFTISGDYKFTCNLTSIPGVNKPGLVKGKLNYTDSTLGPNDYLLEELEAGAQNEPDATYNDGNFMLETQLPGFMPLIGTLTPSTDKKSFTFTSPNPTATEFFGKYGDFIKEE